MSTNEQEIATFRALKEDKDLPHPDLCMCEDCLALRNEEEFEPLVWKGEVRENGWHRTRGPQADDPPGCRCSGCLYRGEKFAYYEDLRTRFKSAVIKSTDHYSGTGFNYIAAELNDLLANPPRVDECMVKHIIGGVLDGLKDLAQIENPEQYHHLDKELVNNAKFGFAAGESDD